MDDLVKDHIDLLNNFLIFNFNFALLCISADPCHKCSELQQDTLVPLDTLTHFPSALHLLLPKAARAPSQQEFRHPLEGKNASGVTATVHKPCLCCSQGSAPQAKSGEWWVLWVIHPKTLQDNRITSFSETSVLVWQKKNLLEEVKIGH